jgi:tetratricopeptide (TPR) repeat protein
MNLGIAKKRATGTAELDPMAEFREGVKLLKAEYPQKALVRFRRAFECDKHNPFHLSFLGLSIARAQRKWEQAAELCEIAVQRRPTEIQFHLNLGEVYALAGRREKALDKLDDALKLFGEDTRLRQAHSKLENRRNPLLPFIGREHFLNRELGKLRHRALKRLGKDGV